MTLIALGSRGVSEKVSSATLPSISSSCHAPTRSCIPLSHLLAVSSWRSGKNFWLSSIAYLSVLVLMRTSCSSVAAALMTKSSIAPVHLFQLRSSRRLRLSIMGSDLSLFWTKAFALFPVALTLSDLCFLQNFFTARRCCLTILSAISDQDWRSPLLRAFRRAFLSSARSTSLSRHSLNACRLRRSRRIIFVTFGVGR